MVKQLRKRDFKLGCIHGKIQPEKGESEYAIQRKVFVSPGMEINWTRYNRERIRIFGYEIPLSAGTTRGNCVDLMGYNEDKDLYLIELKKKDSNEDLSKVNKQINDYAERMETIQPHLEKEFRETFFYGIKFKSIKKLVLAPREFYEKNIESKDSSIIYGYFRDRDITTRKSFGYVQVHIRK